VVGGVTVMFVVDKMSLCNKNRWNNDDITTISDNEEIHLFTRLVWLHRYV